MLDFGSLGHKLLANRRFALYSSAGKLSARVYSYSLLTCLLLLLVCIFFLKTTFLNPFFPKNNLGASGIVLSQTAFKSTDNFVKGVEVAAVKGTTEMTRDGMLMVLLLFHGLTW